MAWIRNKFDHGLEEVRAIGKKKQKKGNKEKKSSNSSPLMLKVYPSEKLSIAEIPEGASLLNFALPAKVTASTDVKALAALIQTPYGSPFTGSTCSVFGEKHCEKGGQKCFFDKTNDPAQCSLDWCSVFTKETLDQVDPAVRNECDCQTGKCQLRSRVESTALAGVAQDQIPIEAQPFPNM